MGTQVRKGVKNKLERNVDDLYDIMRKNRERREKKKQGRRSWTLPGLVDWAIPLSVYASLFTALIAKCPRFPHPYF